MFIFKRPEMSGECKKQIRRRQKLMSEDYKISLSLAKACKVKEKKTEGFRDSF